MQRSNVLGYVLHGGDDVIASDWMDVVKEIVEGSQGEHAMIINETRRMKEEVGYIFFVMSIESPMRMLIV